MNEFSKKLNRNFFECIFVALIGVAIPLFSFLGWFIIEGQPLNTWFQRSGAVTVLASVWIEYNLLKASSIINPVGMISQAQKDAIAKYKSPLEYFQYFVALLAICGTAIWGYGDLFPFVRT